jgi:hypothetical protein
MAAYDPTLVITDPDSLSALVKLTGAETDGSNIHEVVIDTVGKTIKLVTGGSRTLTINGVTLKCLYSFLKERWKNDTDLIKFAFPMTPITDEQFEFYNGWNLDKTGTGSTYTPNLIRTGGWAVKHSGTGNDTERWASVISLGSLGSTDQVYYQQIDSTATDNTTAIVLTGAVNQAVQFYQDTNGDLSPDYNYSQFLKLFCREWQKTYVSSALADIGVTTLTYQAYRFPLANTTDSKLTTLAASESAASGVSKNVAGATWAGSVANVNVVSHGFSSGESIVVAGITPSGYNGTYTITGVSTNYLTYALVSDPGTYTSGGTVAGAKYNNMNIKWYTSGQTQTGFNSPSTAFFKVLLDADVSGAQNPNPTAEEIYAFIQAQLRRAVNINSGDGTGGTVNGGKVGKVVPDKLRFVGDDLYTLGQATGSEGVFILDYNDADINRLHFWGYGSAFGNASVVNNASWSANTATFMTSTAHGFTTNDRVTVSGVTPTGYNSTYQITVGNSVSFTSTLVGDPGAFSAAGSVVAAEYQNIQYPYTAVLTLSFGDNLKNDAAAIYSVFFTNDDAGDNTGRDFGTKDAIVANVKAGTPMTGNIGGASSVQLQYDYDGNTQRGAASAGTNAPITVVAIGLSTAQYVKAEGTIAKSISNSVSLVAPLERNYQNA